MPVVLYLSPATKSDDGRHLPAIHFGISRTPPAATNSGAANADIFRHFILTVKNLTLNIEEELLYKLARFFGPIEQEGEQEEEEEVRGKSSCIVVRKLVLLTRDKNFI